jgi:hypothetical protein
MGVNYAESETQKIWKTRLQESGIEKKRRINISSTDRKTMSSTRERPAQTSDCCFDSLRSLSVYVVATRAVSMRSLGGWYIRDRLVSVFYVSWTAFGIKYMTVRVARVLLLV